MRVATPCVAPCMERRPDPPPHPPAAPLLPLLPACLPHTDAAYHSLFKPVISKLMEVYQPEAVVLQCGEAGGHRRAGANSCWWSRCPGLAALRRACRSPRPSRLPCHVLTHAFHPRLHSRHPPPQAPTP